MTPTNAPLLEVIYTGIGEIHYDIPTGNLLLQNLMENFEATIKKHGAKNVNDYLAKII